MIGRVPPRGPSSESQLQLSESVKGVSCFIDCELRVLSTDLLYRDTQRSDRYPLHTLFVMHETKDWKRKKSTVDFQDAFYSLHRFLTISSQGLVRYHSDKI